MCEDCCNIYRKRTGISAFWPYRVRVYGTEDKKNPCPRSSGTRQASHEITVEKFEIKGALIGGIGGGIGTLSQAGN